MSATNQELLTATGGFPIPQAYDPELDAYVPVTGTTADGLFSQAVDGAYATIGAKADAAATSSTAAWSVVALLKGIFAQLASLVGLRTPATATTTVVPGSATAVTLLAANAARKGGTIYNDSAASLYVKLGSAASASSFHALLLDNASGVGGYWEVPFGYTGVVTGVWASATGNARIGELT